MNHSFDILRENGQAINLSQWLFTIYDNNIDTPFSTPVNFELMS